MRIMTLLLTALGLFAPSVALAQMNYLAIPSSGFTPRNSTTVVNPLRGTLETRGHTGNASGTARFFGDNVQMFAPVNLPHGSTVISLDCAGRAPRLSRKIDFYLRRNEPQQANVDMAGVFLDLDVTSFQNKSTSRIDSPVIDNRRFNYYIVAEMSGVGNTIISECPTCSVNRCTIGYAMLPDTDPPVIIGR